MFAVESHCVERMGGISVCTLYSWCLGRVGLFNPVFVNFASVHSCLKACTTLLGI